MGNVREGIYILDTSEEFCLLEYKAVSSVDSQRTLRRKTLIHSAGRNNNMSDKPALHRLVIKLVGSACHLSRWFLAQHILRP
jgi:hypothetical protein